MSEVIEYDKLVSFLKNASLFEIYRLSVAIDNELENPERIKSVRQKFKEGDVIEYFDQNTNHFVKARVIQKKHKRVSVINCDDNARWNICYHSIKLDAREFDFNTQSKGMNKNALKVGDLVGFNNDGQEHVGRVERLNQKTVSLITTTNQKWRVGYRGLYPIIEGQGDQQNTLYLEK